MKNQIKFKLLILFFCFLVNHYNGIANDTIRMVTTYISGWQHQYIYVYDGTQFSVNWGDGSDIEVFTGEVAYPCQQELSHFYHQMGKYEVTISGYDDCYIFMFNSDNAEKVDLSNCPSINSYGNGIGLGDHTLSSLNTRNCTYLQTIEVRNNKLTVLDLRDNTNLLYLNCKNNQLTRIDLVSIDLLLYCSENRLPLSNLYALSEIISDPVHKGFGSQEFLTQRVALGDAIDFSTEKEFGGIATVFQVEKEGVPAPQEDYQIIEGIITFFKSGFYRVSMTNDAIVSNPFYPAVVVAPFIVIDYVPVTEIINVPTEAEVGVPLTLTGTVIPENATYTTIVWSVKDAGTTGATVTGDTLIATTKGTAIVTATIPDGSAIGTDYTQDFCVDVLPLGVAETHGRASLQAWPNPNSGTFQIETNFPASHISNLKVINTLGITVYETQHLVSNEIQLQNSGNGLYFVVIILKNGTILRQKMMVQR